MAITFPSSPTVGQTFTADGKTWEWNGSRWSGLASSTNINAAQLGGLTASQFLRSDANDTMFGQLTIDGFTGNKGLSFREGFSPENVGIRAKAITTSNRDGLELLGYNGIDLTINNGSTVAMHINGQGIASGAGNVGIGTVSPVTKLDVFGPSSVTSFTGTSPLGVAVRGSTSTTDYSGIDFSGNNRTTPTARIAVLSTGSGSSIQFGTSNSYVSGITNTALTIDNNGRVTMPYQPLFSASDTGALNITGQVLTSSNCYNSIDYNVGGHFNASNGRFTAPIAGYYDCSFHCADLSASGKNVNVRIRKNGVSNTGPLTEGYNQAGLGSTNVFVRCIIQCAVGDYIDFEAARLETVAGIQHKRFIIHMIG